MSTLTFDTHSFVKRLVAAGMPEEQAEVLAEEQTRLIDEKVATKRDLKDVETVLKRDIKELELRLTIKLGMMLAVSIAVMAGLVKLL